MPRTQHPLPFGFDQPPRYARGRPRRPRAAPPPAQARGTRRETITLIARQHQPKGWGSPVVLERTGSISRFRVRQIRGTAGGGEHMPSLVEQVFECQVFFSAASGAAATAGTQPGLDPAALSHTTCLVPSHLVPAWFGGQHGFQ